MRKIITFILALVVLTGCSQSSDYYGNYGIAVRDGYAYLIISWEYPDEKDYAQAYEQYQDDVDMYDKHLLEYNKKIAGLHLASDVYETQAEMLDYIEKVQSVEIPAPPILTDNMSESEYNELMKIYEKELAEYRNQSYLYDLRGKMLNVKMSSTMAILNWLTSKMNF